MRRPGRKCSSREWPVEKTERMLELHGANIPRREIAELLGVTLGSLDMKLYNMRRAEQNQAEDWLPPDSGSQAWTRNRERWTEEENANLVASHDRRESFQSIGRRLNRTTWSCKLQYHSLKRGTAATPGAVAATQRTTREAINARIHEVRCEPLRYASPFSEMLGEPPIGRRAIDRKMDLNHRTTAVAATAERSP